MACTGGTPALFEKPEDERVTAFKGSQLEAWITNKQNNLGRLFYIKTGDRPESLCYREIFDPI
jgi:hypothetical protein